MLILMARMVRDRETGRKLEFYSVLYQILYIIVGYVFMDGHPSSPALR